MKKAIALALCATLVVTPLQTNAVPQGETNPQNSFVMAMCLAGGAAIVGGVVVFMIKTCKPKYYCVRDEEGNRFPSNATKTERAAKDWKVVSGPYKSAEEATQYCPPKTNTTQQITMALQAAGDEVYIPEVPIKIWKSADLTNWILADTIMDDPTNFSWNETNAVSANVQMFYRASY